MKKRTEILEKAREAVCGEREVDYGSPEDNFKKIAELWSVYLGHQVSALDVAVMMALLKIARISTGTATMDSFVDLAGYAACGGEIADASATASCTIEDSNIMEAARYIRDKLGQIAETIGAGF